MAKNDGSGGYFNGDTWVEIVWGDKISGGLKKRPTEIRQCAGCGNDFESVQGRNAKWCNRKCRYKTQYTDKTGIEKKVIVCGANLIMGGRKREFLKKLISDGLGTLCIYCDAEISLDNLTIDHKEAYNSSERRRNKAANKEYRQHMDRQENLQIICKNCNQIKGSMSDVQFSGLLEYLNSDKSLKNHILTRLKRSMLPFARGKFRK